MGLMPNRERNQDVYKRQVVGGVVVNDELEIMLLGGPRLCVGSGPKPFSGALYLSLIHISRKIMPPIMRKAVKYIVLGSMRLNINC